MLKIARSSLCLAISIVMILSLNVWFSTTVAAEETSTQPRWSYTSHTITDLIVTTTGTASCSASATGYYGTATKVQIKMQLQQYLALQWTTIAEWNGTFNNYRGVLDKTKTLTSTGNYRVKAVYTVYAGSASEQSTAYSQERYYIKK